MEDGESCLHYAKRVGSMIYTKRHGKPPTEAEQEIEFIELIEQFLGIKHDESD